MTIAAIRRKLHDYLEVADDKKLKAIYTLVEQEAIEEYTDDFKAELDKRYSEYKKDGKVITREAMDKRIRKELSK